MPTLRTEFLLKRFETFARFATPIWRRELWSESSRDSVPWASSKNREEYLIMTKTTKAMLAGAALAGLLAGTGAPVNASTLLPSLKTSFSAQDQGQDKGKKDDQQVKEKHACKGQNSCKGKGGCATDGSKKPE